MLDINSIKRFPESPAITQEEKSSEDAFNAIWKLMDGFPVSDFELGKRRGREELAEKLTQVLNEKGFIDLGDIVNAMQENNLNK